MNSGKIDKILRSFYQISGMEITLADDRYHSIAGYRCPGENFCALIHKSSACLEVCKGSDIERFSEAERIVAPLRYVCPFGITETIIPILSEGRVTASIFCAMGIEDIEGIDEDILARVMAVASNLSAQSVARSIAEMPHFTAERLNAYYELLGVIAASIEYCVPIGGSNPTIGELIKNYIKNNLSRRITLTDLSWNLHCSTVTLTEHFRAEFGMTVMEYVAKKRMSLAEQLLTTTKKTLGEIAVACGFSDVEYFSRTFRKYHGLPPGRWRRGRGGEGRGERE